MKRTHIFYGIIIYCLILHINGNIYCMLKDPEYNNCVKTLKLNKKIICFFTDNALFIDIRTIGATHGYDFPHNCSMSVSPSHIKIQKNKGIYERATTTHDGIVAFYKGNFYINHKLIKFTKRIEYTIDYLIS